MPSRPASNERLNNRLPSSSGIELNASINRQVVIHFKRLSRKYRGIEQDEVRQTIRLAAWEATSNFDATRGGFDNFVGFIADRKLSKAKKVYPTEPLEELSYRPFTEEFVDFKRKFSLV